MFVLVASCIGSYGAIMLKKVSSHVRECIKHPVKNPQLVIALLFYGLSTVFFIIALKFGELSVLYPLVATTYIWTCLLSVKYLNESMSKLKWFGVLFILIGVSLIGLGS